jgi:glycosyltransferase involved in cell wall biosynthesis
MLENRPIIVFASAPWSAQTRVNCHYIAELLSRTNKVYFIETIGSRVPTSKDIKKIIKRMINYFKGIQKINSNLFILSPLILPIYYHKVFRINKLLLKFQLNLFKGLNLNNIRPIVWVFLPQTVTMIKSLNPHFIIYHEIDRISLNPGAKTTFIEECREKLFEESDVIIRVSHLDGPNKAFIHFPSLGNSRHFQTVREPTLPIPKDIDHISHPIAGYIGNIANYKIDMELLLKVAIKRKDWNFVLLGPVGIGDPGTDISLLKSLPNVYLLGRKSYGKLPAYIKKFDVCLILARNNEQMLSNFPMKFFEYMATGKPIVGIDLPCLSHFKNYFRGANTVDEFSDALQSALTQDTQTKSINNRIRLADTYNWETQFPILINQIEKQMTHRSTKIPRNRR